eukprot:6192917-Pleurochrysis_carterae.AAC.1
MGKGSPAAGRRAVNAKGAHAPFVGVRARRRARPRSAAAQNARRTRDTGEATCAWTPAVGLAAHEQRQRNTPGRSENFGQVLGQLKLASGKDLCEEENLRKTKGLQRKREAAGHPVIAAGSGQHVSNIGSVSHERKAASHR